MTERLHVHLSLSCSGEGNGNPLQCSCLENPRDGGAYVVAFVLQQQSLATKFKVFTIRPFIGEGFPGGTVVKNLPAMQETRIQSLGQEDPLEKEMATCSSILAWRIPGSGEPGGLPSMGLHRVGHN